MTRSPADDHFGAIFHASALGIAIVEPSGRPRRCNAALQAFLGYTEDELCSMQFTEFTHPADVGRDWQLYQELVDGKRAHYQIEKRYLHKDGRVLWGRLTVSLLTAEEPLVLGMVEDRTQAVTQTAQQKRLLSTLGERVKELSALHDITSLLNQEQLPIREVLRRVLDHLPAALQFPERAAARIRHGSDEYATSAFTDSTCQLVTRRALTSGSALQIELAYPSPSATTTSDPPFLSEESRLLESVADLVAGALDRRCARERLELALLETGAGVWEWHVETGRVFWSEQMEHLVGLAPGEFGGTIEAFRALVHAEDAAATQAAMRRAFEDPGIRYTIEFRLKPKTGDYVWLSSSARVFRDENGKPERVVGLAVDCTKRRRLEDRVHQAQKMEAIGSLAAGVAHDFNNVLSVVTSYAELLQLDLRPDDPLRSELQEIRKAARRGAELTRHLLAFSRQQVLQPRVFDLNRVLLDLDKMLRRLIREDIELAVVPGAELGRVRADPGQIEQVIVNLVVNARDAMPAGGKLSIETGNVELDSNYTESQVDVTPGQYVLLAVTDSGIGMSPEVRARIFEPFFTTKEQGKGTGLGLATVFGIVRQSGGHIAVYSEPERGTAFKVYLPRVDRDAQPLAARGEPDLRGGTETILLVEDEPQVRAISSKILIRYGYQVLSAASSGEALLICEQHASPIELLITDVVMPRMGGRALAERVKAIRPEIEVLYMSGYTDDAVIRHGILEDGVAFLQKPITTAELLSKVRAVLDARTPGDP